MAKEGDASYIADIVSWGMPFTAVLLGIPIFAALEGISWIGRKLRKPPSADYRDRMRAEIAYFRTHPADPPILSEPASPARQSGH